MGIQTDVLSAYLDATGTAVSHRARVKSVVVTPGSTAGSVILRDGGATGTVRIRFDIPGGGGVCDIGIPEQGALFTTDVHATLTDVDAVTLFHG